MKTIFCVAGRSGGHIIPCLSYAERLLEVEPDLKLVFFSGNTKLDKQLLQNHPSVWKTVPLPLSNVPGKNIFKWIFFSLQLFATGLISLYQVIKYRPQLVISTGGYLSIPLCLIARLFKIRVELFELNVVPGKAVTFLAPFVSVIKTCFPETHYYLKKGRIAMTPYPLRSSYFYNHCSKEQILKKLHFKKTNKTLLILGGSQGSTQINNLILETIKQYPEKEFLQIIHQVGNSDPEIFKTFYNHLGITSYVFKFHDHLEQLYPAADVVICRSGAGSLFETLYFKKRCITIPLETKTNQHQVKNAESFQKNHPEQFSMLRYKELEENPTLLMETILKS